MSLDLDIFDNIEDFESEKTEIRDLEENGVWIKNAENNDLIDESNIAENPQEASINPDDIFDDTSIFEEDLPSFDDNDLITDDFSSEPAIAEPAIETPTGFSDDTTIVSTTEDTPQTDYTDAYNSIDEIDLAAFGVDFDDPPSPTPSASSSASTSSSSDEISLDDFGVDFGDSESVSLDDFMGKQEEKNDIVGDDPIDIDLSFDDNFALSTIAKPEDNIDTEGSPKPAATGDVLIDNFDDIFDNITEIGEPTPKEEEKSATEYDEVSEFDDLLNSISDIPSAENENNKKAAVQEVVAYDLQVSLDDNEIIADSTPEIEDDVEDIEVSLYSDIEEEKAETKPAEIIATSGDTFSIADIDDSIIFIDETEGADTGKKEQNSTNNNEDAMNDDLNTTEINDLDNISFEEIDIDSIFDDSSSEITTKDSVNEENPSSGATETIEDISVEKAFTEEMTEPETIADEADAFEELTIEEPETIADEADAFEELTIEDTTFDDPFAEPFEETPIDDVLQESLVTEETFEENALEEDSFAVDSSTLEFTDPLEDYPFKPNDTAEENPFAEEEPVETPLETADFDATDDFAIDDLPEMPNEDSFEEVTFDENSTIITQDIENINKNLDTTAETDYNGISQIEENDSVDINESETVNSMGNSLLEKIVEELSVLKAEMASIKEEINSIKNEPAKIEDSVSEDLPEIQEKQESSGFFADDGEDDTIALSGDELNNILNSANFTEEIVNDQPEDFATNADEVSDDDSFYDDDDEEAPGLDIPQEQLQEPEIDNIEFNMDTPEVATEDEVESIDDGFVVESSNLDLLEDDPTIEETLSEDKVSYLAEDEGLEDLDLDASEEIDIPSIDDVDTSDFAVEDTSEVIESELDTELESQIQIDDEIDSVAEELEAPGTEPAETFAEVEDTPVSGVFGSQWDSFDASDDEDTTLVQDEIAEPEVEPIAEPEVEPEIEPVAEPVAEKPATRSSIDAMPEDLKQDVRSVLEYMDQLLENLPEDKIAEFARSEHFETYKKLFTELGLA